MKQKKIPQRMCVGCQQMKNKKELLRVVKTPEGDIVLDPTGKKAGRGVYVCNNEECFTKAFKEHRLERSLKQTVAPDIYQELKNKIKDIPKDNL